MSYFSQFMRSQVQFINVNYVEMVKSCSVYCYDLGEINLSPSALWNQTASTVVGNSNGTAGSSLDKLLSPIGIMISEEDLLYVADTQNHRILVVHADHSSLLPRCAERSNAETIPKWFKSDYCL